MTDRLADDNVKRLLFKLSLPAMTGMFVMALYNLVDTIFVGRGVGTLGIAGLSIVFPIQMIVMALGLLFGIGSASVISRLLGAGDKKGAEQAYCNAAASAILSGTLLSVVGLVFQESILALFGASPEILPSARDYYQVIMFASPFFVMAMTGNNILRSVGMARSAMITMITGAAINIALDPIFIFVLDMGIRGAALATVISQIISVAYLISELRPARSGLHVSVRAFRFRADIMRQITAIGFSSFLRNVASSFVVAMVNSKLQVYGTAVSIAAYGVVMRLTRFLIMPLLGVAQGMQPIVGYNFGAGRHDKVQLACKTGLLWGTGVSTFGFLLVQLFPEQLISMFSNDPVLLQAGTEAVRIMMLGLWVVGFQIVGTSIFQALGKARESLILSLSREVLFFIPALLLLPPKIGLNGVWFSVPAADVLAFCVTLFLVLRQRAKYREIAIPAPAAV